MEQLTDVQPTDGSSPTSSLRVMAVDADLVRLAGDGNTALILRQTIFWWHVRGGRPFYKFNEPAPKHRAYRPRDSWVEETGLTRHQFKTARKRLAVKVQGSDPQQLAAALAGDALVVYWTTEDHLTWYVLNETRLRACAPALYERLLGGDEPSVESLDQPPRALQAPEGGRTTPETACAVPVPSTQRSGTGETRDWSKSNKAASPFSQYGSRLLAREPGNVPPQPAPVALATPAPALPPTHACGLASGDAQEAPIDQEAGVTPLEQEPHLPSAPQPDATFQHQPDADILPPDAALPPPECSLTAFPDAAPSHLLMPESSIGITEIKAESFLQREQSETYSQRLPSLPPTARVRASQEEEGEQEGWSQAEQAKIQTALEARGVFADPARQIAERAVREGLDVEMVVERFDAQMCEAMRSQTRNPLTVVVWRLQHQPLRLPSGSSRDGVRAFLVESLPEAGEAEWCTGAQDTSPEEALLPEQTDEEQSVWRTILDDLRLQMTRATFEQWLKDTHLEGVEDDVWVISTPNPYAPEVLTHRLGQLIRQTLARQLGKGVEVRFVVAEEQPE